MEKYKSWKFWIAMLITIAVTVVVAVFLPKIFWVIVASHILILAFYLKCVYGTFSLPWTASLNVRTRQKRGEDVVEEPGAVLIGMALGVVLSWIVIVEWC